SEKISWLRILALVINIAAVVYLLLTKRLFGLRGGKAAYEAERHEANLMEVQEAAAPERPGHHRRAAPPPAQRPAYPRARRQAHHPRHCRRRPRGRRHQARAGHGRRTGARPPWLDAEHRRRSPTRSDERGSGTIRAIARLSPGLAEIAFAFVTPVDKIQAVHH